jgi:hypothetical protein
MSNIPTTPFWAVTYVDTRTVPADERSRTNPGHGYPEHELRTQKLDVFKDEKAMIDWISLKKTNNPNLEYTILKCFPGTLKVEVKTSVHFHND